MLSEVSRWLDSAVWDYVEVKDGALRMQSVVMQRSLRPHWGCCHQRLACHTVLMSEWGKCKWSVIFGGQISPFCQLLPVVSTLQISKYCLVRHYRGSGLDHFLFITLLVSVHLTAHVSARSKQGYVIIFFMFGWGLPWETALLMKQRHWALQPHVWQQVALKLQLFRFSHFLFLTSYLH